MYGTPDGLVHNSQVFGTGYIRIMTSRQIKNKITRKEENHQSNKTHCHPE